MKNLRIETPDLKNLVELDPIDKSEQNRVEQNRAKQDSVEQDRTEILR